MLAGGREDGNVLLDLLRSKKSIKLSLCEAWVAIHTSGGQQTIGLAVQIIKSQQVISIRESQACADLGLGRGSEEKEEKKRHLRAVYSNYLEAGGSAVSWASVNFIKRSNYERQAFHANLGQQLA